MKLYRGFESRQQIDEQYNASMRVSDYADWMKWYQNQSLETRAAHHCERAQFGPTRDEYLAIFAAASADAPVMMFIHGGYWRAGSSDDFLFVAKGLLRRGFCVAVSNYSLCPGVTIDEISRQSRAAVAWLYQHAHRFNGNPDKVLVSGHSAGGQQVGMLVSTDWPGDYGLPADVVKGAVSLSGVFDLRPLRYSYLQPAIRLSHEIINRQSPMFLSPCAKTRLVLAVGELESSEFHRQSESYSQWCEQNGLSNELWVRAERHHFDVIADFERSDSELVNRCVALLD